MSKLTYNPAKLQKILNLAKELIKELTSKPHCEVKKIPLTQGVYLIRNKNQEIIYVGKGKNLNRRINSDHISGELKISTSTFRRHINKQLNIPPGKELRKWIIDNCLFSYIEIKDSDLCDMVESLAILVLRANGNKLLNHLV